MVFCFAANYNHGEASHLQSNANGELSSGGEVDLRSTSAGGTSDNYLTPAHYPVYDESSDYHGLGQEHHSSGHPYALDGSPEFYNQASSMQIEHKYQPPSHFKGYHRGNYIYGLNINS